jgi:hypothetical protein
MSLEGSLVDDLRRELEIGDGIEWFKQDPIYEHLADGFPHVLKEIASRDTEYLVITELSLTVVRRLQKEGRNKTWEVKKWISDFIDSMAEKSPALEDELNRAYESGKSKKQIINEAFGDLERTKDRGMSGEADKYLPLIERKDGYVFLTPIAEEFFNPIISQRYGYDWMHLPKSIRIDERRRMGLPYIEEP